MQVETVTVGLSLTESLPDYNNVKPSLSFTARLEPGESVAAVVADLHARVTTYCHDEVDAALEAADQPPRYFTGPLFRLYLWKQRDALVILPSEIKQLYDLPGSWRSLSSACRLETARQRAFLQHQPFQEVIEATSPDELEDLQLWWDAQTWYVAYSLVIWEDHHDYASNHMLFIRHDLSLPEEMKRIDDVPRTLKDYTACQWLDYVDLFPDLTGWTAVDDQATLDRLVADWLTEHPRPEIDF